MPLDYLVKLFNTKKNKTNQLKQGSLFLKHKKKYKKGMIEGFSVSETNKKLEEAGVSSSSLQMEQLKELFNTTLEQYSDLYTNYLTQKIENKSTDNYVGKSIEYDNKKYYINDNGYIQEYKNSNAWNNRSKGNGIGLCPSVDKSLSDNLSSEQLNNLKKFSGAPIANQHFPCKGFSGVNIMVKKDTKTLYAWMDVQGYKHMYDDNNNDIPKKHISCPDEFKEISEEQWDAIPEDYKMTPSKKCEPSNSNTATTDILKKLNNKLIEYARQMKQISDEEKQYTGDIDDEQKTIGIKVESKTNQLLAEKSELDRLRTQVKDLVTSYDEKKKDIGSVTLQNIVWLSALVILLGIIINRIVSMGRR